METRAEEPTEKNNFLVKNSSICKIESRVELLVSLDKIFGKFEFSRYSFNFCPFFENRFRYSGKIEMFFGSLSKENVSTKFCFLFT